MNGEFLNLYTAVRKISHIPFAENIAPDQSEHPCSLTRELHGLLICKIDCHRLIIGQYLLEQHVWISENQFGAAMSVNNIV